jgi:hypothetical protein
MRLALAWRPPGGVQWRYCAKIVLAAAIGYFLTQDALDAAARLLDQLAANERLLRPAQARLYDALGAMVKAARDGSVERRVLPCDAPDLRTFRVAPPAGRAAGGAWSLVDRQAAGTRNGTNVQYRPGP